MSASPAETLDVREVTDDTWDDFVALFESRGGPDYCWSIVCFFVTRDLRRHGVMATLIESAADHARENGATVLEAYPVDPDSPSYRFMGFVSVFEDAGFSEVGKVGTRRHVMRLDLT